MAANRVFYVLFIYYQEDDESDNNSEIYNKENTIVQKIINNKAVAAYDISIGEYHIAGVWKITNNYNDKLI